MEDGSHLVQILADKDEIPTVITNKINNTPTEKTLEFSNISDPIKGYSKKAKPILSNEIKPKIDEKLTIFKEKVSYQGLRTIEILPMILALANNYWQWLYLSKSSFGDTFSFLISANFIVWFLLLVLGLISCFIAIKFGKNKGFAITALVILAVNLLLTIVPLK
jgi:magnesium-transporting ATPase (P-type)